MTLSRLSLGTVLALTLAAGCGSTTTTQAPDTTPIDKGVEPGPVQPPGGPVTGQGTEQNPYGKAYPTQNLGYTPRAGKRAGNIMRNYKFLGYRDGDLSKGQQVISLADLYDPEMRTNKLIHFSAGALWCPPCNDEAGVLVPLIPSLKAKKVIIIQAIIEGSARGTGATLKDLDVWQQRHKVNYTVFTDPEQANLGQFFESAAIPWNAVLDARSMEILESGVGNSDSIINGGYDSWSKWIDENPAQAVQ
jgi:AhpC/TSA family